MGSISARIPKFADTVLKPFRSSLRYCGFPEVADSLELSTRRKAAHSTSGFLSKVQEFFTNLKNSIIEAFGGNKTKKSSTQNSSGSWLLGGTALASTALAVTYSDQIMASVRSQFQKWGLIEADKRMGSQFLSSQATANASKSGGWFKYAALVVLVPVAIFAHRANPGWFEKLLKQSKKGPEVDQSASAASVLPESKGAGSAVSKEEETVVPPAPEPSPLKPPGSVFIPPKPPVISPELQKKMETFSQQRETLRSLGLDSAELNANLSQVGNNFGCEQQKLAFPQLREEAYQLSSEHGAQIIEESREIYIKKTMLALETQQEFIKGANGKLSKPEKELMELKAELSLERNNLSGSEQWWCDHRLALIDKELASRVSKRGSLSALPKLTSQEFNALQTPADLWKADLKDEIFKQRSSTTECHLYSSLRSMAQQPGGRELLERIEIKQAADKGGYFVKCAPLEYETEPLYLFVSNAEIAADKAEMAPGFEGFSRQHPNESLGTQLIRLSAQKHPEALLNDQIDSAFTTMNRFLGPIGNSEVSVSREGLELDGKNPVAELKKLIATTKTPNGDPFALVAVENGQVHYYSATWYDLPEGQIRVGNSLQGDLAKRHTANPDNEDKIMPIEDFVRDYNFEGRTFSKKQQ